MRRLAEPDAPSVDEVRVRVVADAPVVLPAIAADARVFIPEHRFRHVNRIRRFSMRSAIGGMHLPIQQK
jgi:hypothetical protein